MKTKSTIIKPHKMMAENTSAADNAVSIPRMLFCPSWANINAAPAEKKKRRGLSPSTHDFFLRLSSATIALLIIIPLFYWLVTHG